MVAEVACMNAGAALVAVGRARTFRDGTEQARRALPGVARLLEALTRFA
jgi:anthranilate phosphoribosyltransferase